ncbi:hypothetical protein [Undibacterium sp.]|nr:hypothetical protein [Undibacterium sp.]MDP1978291.1 hypothetical protein [Undibacterium sp.]
MFITIHIAKTPKPALSLRQVLNTPNPVSGQPPAPESRGFFTSIGFPMAG